VCCAQNFPVTCHENTLSIHLCCRHTPLCQPSQARHAMNPGWTSPCAAAVRTPCIPHRQGAGRRIAKQPFSTHRWRVWRDLAEYFPVQLHKTADLDPAGTYVFGFHPHGILCLSAWVSFATEACDVGAKCVASYFTARQPANSVTFPHLLASGSTSTARLPRRNPSWPGLRPLWVDRRPSQQLRSRAIVAPCLSRVGHRQLAYGDVCNSSVEHRRRRRHEFCVSAASCCLPAAHGEEQHTQTLSLTLLRASACRFPGIQQHVLTLVPNLRTPFLREYLLMHGVSDCSHTTCETILRRRVLQQNHSVSHAERWPQMPHLDAAYSLPRIQICNGLCTMMCFILDSKT